MAAGILAGQGQAQRKRLAYIDFRLHFLGKVSLANIASKFCIAPAEVTNDLAVYPEAVPGDIVLDSSIKTSGIDPAFRPRSTIRSIGRSLCRRTSGTASEARRAAWSPARFPNSSTVPPRKRGRWSQRP